MMSGALSNPGPGAKRGRARGCAAVLVVCGLLAIGVPAGVHAQGITQQQADEMLRELRAIHELLQKAVQPTAPGGQAGPQDDAPAKLARVTGYMLGRPEAPLTMVEFTDLQCPYCNRFATQTFDAIKKGWIDTGRLRFFSHDFPLPMHQQAHRAARAARCAGEQGKYWELRADLVRNGASLGPDFITQRAAALKLDMAAFAACLDSTRFDADIAQDQRDGSAAGVEGTPTFIVGRTVPEGLDGILIVGALPYEVFDQRLKELLAPAGSPK
jgi:protein-disulfide isomerase